jgi:GAF domain-containing protein
MAVHNQEVESKAERTSLRRIRRQLRKENAFVRLLRVVASVSNESTTIEEPLQTALDAVCALTGWPVGHALLKTDEDKEELHSARLWHLDGPERFETFRRVSEALAFGGGVGLPGRVLASGAATWVPDVTNDTNFPRNRLVQDLGLRAAFAFPILVGREVAGVLEFFHTERAEPDEAILMIMNQVGVQLGRVIERRRAEQTLTSLAKGIMVNKGENFFESVVGHLAGSVKADYALVGQINERGDAVRTLAVCAHGAIVPNFQYALAGTPCEAVAEKSFCSYPQGVREKFPRDRMLADMQVESYVGTPLFDSTGRVLGILAALWCRPPANPRVVESMVQIFAVRAASELERKRAEETAQKLAEVPRANPHPVLEFSGDGVLRFANTGAYVLARSMGKDDPIHILPRDTAGIVRKSLETGKNGIVVDTIGGDRTIIWSFIPIVKNDSVFAHAFELTLFLDLHDEMRRMSGRSRRPRDGARSSGPGRTLRPRRPKESVH